MVGKSGAAIEAVRCDVGNDKCKVEYSTIQCGLRRHLKRCFHDLLPHFQCASQTLGVYMYTAGLASNYIVSRNPDINVNLWKTFYDGVVHEGGASESEPTGGSRTKDVVAIFDINVIRQKCFSNRLALAILITIAHFGNFEDVELRVCLKIIL